MNIEVTEWVLNPQNLEKGLFLVAIGPLRVPVSNQICECGRGWAAPFKFACYENEVYHKRCLKEKLGESEKFFYQGKLFTCRYFFTYELVKIDSLASRLRCPDAVTVEMKPEYFSD